MCIMQSPALSPTIATYTYMCQDYVGISGIINRSLPDTTKAAFARSKFENYFQDVNYMNIQGFAQVNIL